MGALVELEIERSGGGTVLKRVLSSTAGQLRPGGEHERFTQRGVGSNLVAFAQALQAVRRFFEARSFVEVSTPVRVAAPGTDVYIEPIRAGEGWLITSPEFHMKRLLVGGLSRIFQVASASRREECGSWHQPEFTLVEWYRAFCGWDAMMADTELLVRDVAEALGTQAAVLPGGRRIELSFPFARLTVADAYREYADVTDVASLAAEDEAAYFQLWVDRVEPALSLHPEPLFLTEFPLSQAALARPLPGRPDSAERFELMLGGVELCNGYGELTCAATQRARFESEQRQRRAAGLTELPLDEDFLNALEEGMPPSAGNALGLERLVALLLGVTLTDVRAFPE